MRHNGQDRSYFVSWFFLKKKEMIFGFFRVFEKHDFSTFPHLAMFSLNSVFILSTFY